MQSFFFFRSVTLMFWNVLRGHRKLFCGPQKDCGPQFENHWSNSSSFTSPIRLMRHIFINPCKILIFYRHSSSSNSPSSDSSLCSHRYLFLSPRKFLFGLFVICRFDSMFKQYLQFCLQLQDGWIHAVSVISSTRVRS